MYKIEIALKTEVPIAWLGTEVCSRGIDVGEAKDESVGGGRFERRNRRRIQLARSSDRDGYDSKLIEWAVAEIGSQCAAFWIRKSAERSHRLEQCPVLETTMGGEYRANDGLFTSRLCASAVTTAAYQATSVRGTRRAGKAPKRMKSRRLYLQAGQQKWFEFC